MKTPKKSPFFEKIEDLTQMASLIFKSRYFALQIIIIRLQARNLLLRLSLALKQTCIQGLKARNLFFKGYYSLLIWGHNLIQKYLLK